MRLGAGCTDTDNNAADFTTASPPVPRNSATSLNPCGGGTDPTDPVALASASPAVLAAGQGTLLTVEVTPGTNPVSTGLVVIGDLSAIGGSSSQAFVDDGTQGDVFAGDNVFSFQATIPASTPGGMVSLPVGVTDAEARSAATTIELSIVAKVRISDIQGAGIGSPIALGTDVVTEGVVTARRSNGYFIQSRSHDGNPATAEGVFVFTNSAPPIDAVVGNFVRVSGRVSEFSRTPHGFPLTQLTNSNLSVLRTGDSLPTAAGIGGFLVPGFSNDYLGRFQGMRVKIYRADVVGPTNGFGDFYIQRSHLPRPVREPGIALLDAVPLPQGNAIPRFDGNPERLRVESLGLEGGTILNVDAGTRIEGLEGILYYDRGDFTLLLDPASNLALTGGAFVSAVPAPEPASLRIGSYNIENLSGGANINLDRLAKLTDVFCSYLRNPDIVGLVEIANLATAQRLAEAINTNEFDTCPDNPQYVAQLLSNSGSQRLGYLVRTSPAPGGIEPRVQVLSIEERFVGETLTNPQGNPDNILFDRPPLHLVARVTGENGTGYDVDVILNHTLSLLAVKDLGSNAVWGTSGNRSRNKRLQQAVRLSQLVEEIQQTNPDRPLVLIGDYNAFEFSDGYVDMMGIISGTPAAENTVLVHADSAVTMPLTNLLGTREAKQRYSYVFEGNTQSLDHALVNDALLATADATLHHARVNADFAADNSADTTVPVRTSDHDPLVVDLTVPGFLDADLAVSLTSRRAVFQNPWQAIFDAVVFNQGEMRALRPEVTLLFDVPPERLNKVRSIGWECSAPIVDPVGSRVFCGRRLPMESGEADPFLITVQTGPEPSLSVQVEAQTRSVDTDTSNNAADITVGVNPPL
jgi:predicted extracellular nuclease